MCDGVRQLAETHKSLQMLAQAHPTGRNAMTRDDDLHVRIGRIRSRGSRSKPFIAQALAAAEKAGGLARPSRRARAGRFGRGRVASLSASRLLTDPSRRVVIKARVVRQRLGSVPLKAHLVYLRREGVTKDGAAGRMFSAERDDADHRAFTERCEGDRHHFRFIVSPDDATELADLKAFTRDLLAQAQRDLGTRLDWIAVDHWNTEHPHVHVIIRGLADDGQDLVISRDYIREGMRARGEAIVTRELGLRSEQEIRKTLEREVDAERWTRLDQALVRGAGQNGGIIDLRPDRHQQPDELRAIKIGRMRKLERLGLAHPVSVSQWAFSEGAESTLRGLGERNDIIKRIHRSLAERGLERAPANFVLTEDPSSGVIGRLVARGLDDEFAGTAYAVVDGADGRAHHVRLPDLDAAGDSEPGSIVEMRRYQDSRGRQRLALAVRSDLSLEAQVKADGATWLDRQLLARGNPVSEHGFGQEVRAALEARTEYLVSEGFARRQGQRVIFVCDLLDTLRQRELSTAGGRLSTEMGLPYRPAAEGESITGTYRQRLSLASGRFAMIDDGLGFTLVPWTQFLERHLGKHVTGKLAPAGRVEWDFSRKRGLGI
jgi:type IV secretory pathway VirD2 relaxase